MKIPDWILYVLIWGIGGLGMYFLLFYTQMPKNKTPKKELIYSKKQERYIEKDNKNGRQDNNNKHR